MSSIVSCLKFPIHVVSGIAGVANWFAYVFTARLTRDPLKEAADNKASLARVELLLPNKVNPILGKGLSRTQRWEKTIRQDRRYTDISNVMCQLANANDRQDLAGHSNDLFNIVCSIVDPATRVAVSIMYGIDRQDDPDGVRVCMRVIQNNMKLLTDPQDRIGARAAIFHMANTIHEPGVAAVVLSDHTREGRPITEVKSHPACTLK